MNTPLPQKLQEQPSFGPKPGPKGGCFLRIGMGEISFPAGTAQDFSEKLAFPHRLADEGEAILAEFGKNRAPPPTCAQAQALVKKWQAYLTANYYNCTGEILACLGQMYVGDERFVQHIDRYGTGTAAFMAAAIAAYTG